MLYNKPQTFLVLIHTCHNFLELVTSCFLKATQPTKQNYKMSRVNIVTKNNEQTILDGTCSYWKLTKQIGPVTFKYTLIHFLCQISMSVKVHNPSIQLENVWIKITPLIHCKKLLRCFSQWELT